MRLHRNTNIIIKPAAYIVIAAVFLLLPFKFIAAWLLSILIHELSHIFMLWILRVKIYKITFGAFGASIDTEPMPRLIEALSTIAGPIGGFCMLFFAKWLPLTSIFAFIQSVYNLLPIFPLDGGRVVRALLPEKPATVISSIIKYLLIIIGLAISIIFKLGIIPFVALIVFFLKTPCNKSRL